MKKLEFYVVLALGFIALFTGIQPVLSSDVEADEFPLIQEVLAVRDSLLQVAGPLNKKHPALNDNQVTAIYQLGIWTHDTTLAPQIWSPRSTSLYNLSQIKRGRYFGVFLPPQAKSNLHINWMPDFGSELAHSLRLMTDREQLDELYNQYFVEFADDTTYFPHRMLLGATLALKQHDPDSALACCQRLLAARGLKVEVHPPQVTLYAEGVLNVAFQDPLLMSQATILTAQALEKKGENQAAVDTLVWTIHNGGFGDDALFLLGLNLVRLGRVREATQLFELVLELNPYHEMAHYYLGNGMGHYNYTQLYERYPDHFAGEAKAVEIGAVKELLRAGHREEASERLQSLTEQHTELVEPRIILASLAWEDGDMATAEQLCFSVLADVPEYGRVHAIYARVQEVRRMRVSVYHQKEDQDFEAESFPEVPGIEEYVPNWQSLHPRHQKRVAMSVYPWRRFVPVLVATGSTHYIKPLHEILSECPQLESMRDARINLDSRLWDDVRGCGGYHTVTGVEDVERMIYGGYNTVIHELTHQVHGILTEKEKQDIEALYRQAKADEANGSKRFMSRYQGLTFWEYFAEGVNAYHSKPRHQYDSAEIVRERLEELDPALLTLVERFLAVEDMAPYYMVGKLNAAYELVERGKADSALILIEDLPEENSNDKQVLEIKAWLLSILDRDTDALQLAERAVELYPNNAKSHINLASVRFHANQPMESVMDALGQGMLLSGMDEPHELWLDTGRYAWINGEYSRSIHAFTLVLEAQSDLPEAHWGLGLAFGDSSQTFVNKKPSGLLDSSRVHFEKALETRTGIADLRLDFARVLLMHGEYDAAEEQLGEVENLEPENENLVAMRLLHTLLINPTGFTVDVAQTPASPDLLIVLALISQYRSSKGMDIEPPVLEHSPRWVFNPEHWQYETRGTYPQWQRILLTTWAR